MDNIPFRELCAYILESPSCLVQVHRHRIGRDGYYQKPHFHEDLVQFDFFSGCLGSLKLEGTERTLKDSVAAIYYPRETHGYRIDAAQPGPGAVLYNLKILASPGLSFAKERPVSPYQRLQLRCDALLDSLDRLYKAALCAGANPALKASLAIEALALWPERGVFDAGGMSLAETQAPPGEDPFQRALDLVENSFAKQLKIERLAKDAGISRRQLERRFKAVFGIGPQDYLDRRKLKVAQENLSQDSKPVYLVAKELGFSSVHCFSRWFGRRAGVSPTAFRKSGEIL